jgi:hypothetical protein
VVSPVRFQPSPSDGSPDIEDAADTIRVDEEIVVDPPSTGRRVRNRIPSPRVLLR